MYISSFKPFKDKSLYTVELTNELILLLSSYMLFYYADYNNQDGFHEFKYNVGWLIILIIVIFIVYNMIVITKKVLGVIKMKYKAYLASKKGTRKFKYNEDVEGERMR